MIDTSNATDPCYTGLGWFVCASLAEYVGEIDIVSDVGGQELRPVIPIQ